MRGEHRMSITGMSVKKSYSEQRYGGFDPLILRQRKISANPLRGFTVKLLDLVRRNFFIANTYFPLEH